MKDIDISIIIPVYGVESYIEECILSVVNQKNICDICIECILIDDCSPDKSIDIAYRIIKNASTPITFRLLRNPCNMGISESRNNGIREARGRYVFFIDSDDFLSENCICTLYNTALKHPEAQIIVGKAIGHPDPKWMESFLNIDKKCIPEALSNSSLISKYYFTLPDIAWNKLISRAWLIEHNLWYMPNLLMEDHHWHIHAYSKVSNIAVVRNLPPTYFYRCRPGSIMSKSQDELWMYQRRHNVYLHLAPRLDKWDYNIASLYLNTLLLYRRKQETFFEKAHSELVTALHNNRHIPRRLKALFKLTCLPFNFLHIGIFFRLCKLLSSR